MAVAGVVVGIRLVWFFTVPYLIRAVDRRPAQRARRVPARWRLVLAWSGMRGAVSLAVALALPRTTDAGATFPQRDLIVFLTFAVLFFTLVVQGLSLPALIRRLGVNDHAADADEEIRARLRFTRSTRWRVRNGRESRRSSGSARSTNTANAASQHAPAGSRTPATRTRHSPTNEPCSAC